MEEAIKISERERKCLGILAEYYDDELNCLYMRTIAANTKLTIVQTRRSVRSLARKGFVELIRGLIDEETGMLAGSGWCATEKGKKLIETRGR